MNDAFLTVALIQSGLAWENPEMNRTKFAKQVGSLPEETDLVVLPEMFSTGFSMKPARFAEPMDGDTVCWMKEQSRDHNLVVAGSAMIREKQYFFNRFLFVYPSGEICFYDKRHLFAMGLENTSFVRGNERKIFRIKGFMVMPQICYDLRFPVFFRNRSDYDLLINCANWPSSRREVWETLLKARAIENQAYVIGVNSTGTDGNGIRYSGNSLIIDPKGKEIASATSGEEAILTAKLSKSSLDQFRRKFPVLEDGDDFSIEF